VGPRPDASLVLTKDEAATVFARTSITCSAGEGVAYMVRDQVAMQDDIQALNEEEA
jgi:hypothetical protein